MNLEPLKLTLVFFQLCFSVSSSTQDTDFLALVNPVEATVHLLQWGDSSLLNEICES